MIFFLNAKGAAGNIDTVTGQLVDGIILAAPRQLLRSSPEPWYADLPGMPRLEAALTLAKLS